MKHVLSEGLAGLFHQRHDPVAMPLGTAHEHRAGAPADISELKLPQFLVAKPIVASRSIMARSRTPERVVVSMASMARRTSSHASRRGRWVKRQHGVVGTNGAKSCALRSAQRRYRRNERI